MAPPLHVQILERPVTSILAVTCTSVWAWLNHKHLGYQDVGLSYDLVIQRQQFWRIITSQLSHVDFIHLLFNMSSLWSLGGFERGGAASLVFLQQSLWLLVGSGLICLAIYHVAIFALHKEQYRTVTAVGYSAVIFGWMALLSARGISNFSIFGMVQLPMSLAPFGALVITSILIPQASFIGHLSGILMGYLMAFVLYGLTVNAWSSLALLVLTCAGCLWSLRDELGSSNLPALQLPAFFRRTDARSNSDVEAGTHEALLSGQPNSMQ